MDIFRITAHPTRTLVWWYKNRSQIEFNPPYQRKGRLWSQSDKAFLIDSVINGFDIPKLYMADFQLGYSSLNASRLPYAIIDGKQRLEAIFDFFDNRLVLNADFKLRADTHARLGGLSLKDLKNNHPTVADAFENYSLDIMSVVASKEEDINELFVRLNRSKALTGAEVRNAIIGPVPDVARDIASEPFFVENIRFSIKRADDINTATKILYFEYSNKPVGTKKSNLDTFARDANVQSERVELAGRRAIATLAVMNSVFLPQDPLLSSSGLVPVYYWFIRSRVENELHKIREFLVWFEGQRLINRQLLAETDGKEFIDPRLSNYDNLNRSTNDIGSHVGRIEILEQFYQRWLGSMLRV
ncbi:DUF262 domain-containing protein [Brevundimonas bullata]